MFQYVQLQGLVNTVVTDQSNLAGALVMVKEETDILQNTTDSQDSAMAEMREEVRLEVVTL